MAKRRASALSIAQPEAKLVASAPAETKYCAGCLTHAAHSRFTSDQLTDSCREAIWRTAVRDCLARERRLQELEATRSTAATCQAAGCHSSHHLQGHHNNYAKERCGGSVRSTIAKFITAAPCGSNGRLPREGRAHQRRDDSLRIIQVQMSAAKRKII
jgi:hypothetical protein